jgi:hypothetical protein
VVLQTHLAMVELEQAEQALVDILEEPLEVLEFQQRAVQAGQAVEVVIPLAITAMDIQAAQVYLAAVEVQDKIF